MIHACTANTDLDELIGRETLNGPQRQFSYGPLAIAMKQVGEGPPGPSSINPKVSPALDAVVLKALAKDPTQRFQSAAEMSAALDAAEGRPDEPVVLAPVPEDRSRRRWIIVAPPRRRSRAARGPSFPCPTFKRRWPSPNTRRR